MFSQHDTLIHDSSTLGRQAYHSPSLKLLGDVGSLTESGSMASMEDYWQNRQCFLRNSTGNMC